MDVPLAVVETITTGLIPVTAVDTTYLTIDVDTLILDTALIFIHPFIQHFNIQVTLLITMRYLLRSAPPPMLTVCT